MTTAFVDIARSALGPDDTVSGDDDGRSLLVAFSCKGRDLCLSCGAKRAAIFSDAVNVAVPPGTP